MPFSIIIARGADILEGYGSHTLIWDSADERLGDSLTTPLGDATERRFKLHMRQDGTAADPTGAEVSLS